MKTNKDWKICGEKEPKSQTNTRSSKEKSAQANASLNRDKV